MPGNLPHHMHILDFVCVYFYVRLCPIYPCFSFCLRALRIKTIFFSLVCEIRGNKCFLVLI